MPDIPTDPAIGTSNPTGVPHLAAPILEARALTRRYRDGKDQVRGCEDVSLDVRPGEIVVLRGRSGAGKSTLLRLLGGLDRPTSGTVHVGGRELSTADEDDLVAVRREDVAFVFQDFGLLPTLSAAENVEIPLRVARVEPAERDRRVAEVLAAVGLERHARQRPTELSGGQQQRVAIARAIVMRHPVLLADEPTGQLDSVTADQIMRLLIGLAHDHDVAVVVSTHDPLIMEQADRVLELRDGRVVAEHGGHGAQAEAEEGLWPPGRGGHAADAPPEPRAAHGEHPEPRAAHGEHPGRAPLSEGEARPPSSGSPTVPEQPRPAGRRSHRA
ncbi:ABC transporter ATP-binding protein [Curtobacterium sp. RRHDQ10]|uniref:ABC transporter ATP-binding protein n=1 Tax=Curtobacterium phyllosphaerae TaxID=3413379 RepID=UPI003BF1BE54